MNSLHTPATIGPLKFAARAAVTIPVQPGSERKEKIISAPPAIAVASAAVQSGAAGSTPIVWTLMPNFSDIGGMTVLSVLSLAGFFSYKKATFVLPRFCARMNCAATPAWVATCRRVAPGAESWVAPQLLLVT